MNIKNAPLKGPKSALRNGSSDLPTLETIQSFTRPVPTLPEPLAYDINQSAAALNMSTKSVRRLIWLGKLKPCKALRKILIPRQQIEDFFKASGDASKFNCSKP